MGMFIAHVDGGIAGLSHQSLGPWSVTDLDLGTG